MSYAYLTLCSCVGLSQLCEVRDLIAYQYSRSVIMVASDIEYVNGLMNQKCYVYFRILKNFYWIGFYFWLAQIWPLNLT